MRIYRSTIVIAVLALFFMLDSRAAAFLPPDHDHPIDLIPGFSRNSTTDCQALFGELVQDFRDGGYGQPMEHWSFYDNSTNCTHDSHAFGNHDLHFGNDWEEENWFTPETHNANGRHTAETPMFHIAYHIANGLDPNETRNLVGFSMGGLIIRYMLDQAAIERRDGVSPREVTDLRVRAAATHGTPFIGIGDPYSGYWGNPANALSAFCSLASLSGQLSVGGHQCASLVYGSGWVIRWFRQHGGRGQGMNQQEPTEWALHGSLGFGGWGDGAVSGMSSIAGPSMSIAVLWNKDGHAIAHTQGLCGPWALPPACVQYYRDSRLHWGDAAIVNWRSHYPSFCGSGYCQYNLWMHVNHSTFRALHF
jgi:hypothetical protein